MSDDDPVIFAPEEDPPAAAPDPWRVLVVDDDEEVQLVTALTLKGLVIDGRSLEISSASTLREAHQAFSTGAEFAVAIIDVVMETPTAGLDLARWVRSALRDHDVRLLLRTGQPGVFGEIQVTEDYDIHDYLAKAETTGRILITRVAGAIRAWRDLIRVRAEARALRYLLDAGGADLTDLCRGVPSLLANPRGRVVAGGADGLPLVGGWRFVPDPPVLTLTERARLSALHEELTARWG